MESLAVQTTDGLEIRGVIDERQIMALRDLWTAWTEEKGDGFHPEAWVPYMKTMISSGHYLPLVAYEGDTPVGMVECLWNTDPFTGLKTGFGDHAYVLPEYRSGGLFTELVAAMAAVAERWGTEAEGLPIAKDAQFLIPLYETYGFEVSGTIMRRKHK